MVTECSQAEKHQSVTRIDLRHGCEAKYSRSISRWRIDSFILRHREDVIGKQNVPYESARVEAPRAFPDETMRCLRKHVQGMKAELVFNLDEVGL
jgi:hypothetical protein